MTRCAAVHGVHGWRCEVWTFPGDAPHTVHKAGMAEWTDAGSRKPAIVATVLPGASPAPRVISKSMARRLAVQRGVKDGSGS